MKRWPWSYVETCHCGSTLRVVKETRMTDRPDSLSIGLQCGRHHATSKIVDRIERVSQ